MTPRQKQAYDFICSYWAAKGHGPSYADIMEHMGIKSKSGVFRVVKALVDYDLIVQKGRKARSIRPKDMKWPPSANVVHVDFGEAKEASK